MEKQAIREQLGLFKTVASNLVLMMETVKSAFNRQCSHDLEELKRYQGIVREEIALASDRIDAHLTQSHLEGRVPLIKLFSVLSHLEMIVGSLNEAIPALNKQIREGIPFSRKGIDQANELFEGQIEILRALVDIFNTDSEILKKWIFEDKGPQVSQACIDFATDHEARLVEGLCLPHAASIFLGLLDVVRTMSRHEMEVAHLLMKEHRGVAAKK